MKKRSRKGLLLVAGIVIVALQVCSTMRFNQHPMIVQFKDQSSSLWASTASSFTSLSPSLGQQQQKANTTLVIVLGNLRCGEDAWESLYRNVLDNNSADLALMIGDTYRQYQNASMFGRAKYIWRFKEYDDWADAIDLIDGPEWRTTLLPHVGNDGLLGGVKGKQSTGGLLMMVRWFLIQHLEEDKILDKYDKFVITRSDHYYQCPHDLAPLDTEQYLWLPEGESYGGYNDRHLVVGRNHIIPAIDLLAPMVKNPTSFTRSKLTMDDNIERFQTRMWNRKGLLPKVRQFKRMMFVCATRFDKTRFMKRTRQKVPKTRHGSIYLKYPDEYHASRAFCRNTSTEILLQHATEQPEFRIPKGVFKNKQK